MLDTQATETQLSDHVARFWNLLQTETVRICLDLKHVVATEAPDGPVVYWDGSTFSDDVAKAVVADRAAKAMESAKLRAALTELHAMVWGECPSLLNEDSGGDANLDLDIRDLINSEAK